MTIIGMPTASSNIFVGSNSGLINGSLNVSNLGGPGSLVNSGTTTGT